MKQSYTIYLLKSDVMRHEDAIELDETQPAERLTTSELDAYLWYKPSRVGESKWVKQLRAHFKIPSNALQSASSGVALVVKFQERFFALTFGMGRFLLKTEKVVTDYGLRVALNTMGEASLQSIETVTPELFAQKSKKQLAKASDIGMFGVNPVMDLLQRVTGMVKSGNDKYSLSGANSLKISTETSLEEIGTFLTTTLQDYAKEDYKEKGYGWIDYIRPIHEKDLCLDLDHLLVEQINQGEPMSIYPKEIGKDEVATDYSFKQGKHRSEKNDLIDWNDFIALIDAKSVSLTDLHKVKLVATINGDQSAEWPIYDCLTCNVEWEDEIYVLTDGNWYKVAQEYSQRIQELYHSHLETDLDNFQLNPYPQGQREEDYSTKMCNTKGNMLKYDQTKYQVDESPKQYEFCDVLDIAHKRIYHLKVWHNGQSISHLCNQAKFSGRFWITDKKFTQAVKNEYNEMKTGLNKHETTIVLGILNRDRDLPFFSQVFIVDTVQYLLQIGYKAVKICHVGT